MTDILRRREDSKGQAQTQSHVKMKAENGVVQEHRGLTATTKELEIKKECFL